MIAAEQSSRAVEGVYGKAITAATSSLPLNSLGNVPTAAATLGTAGMRLLLIPTLLESFQFTLQVLQCCILNL